MIVDSLHKRIKDIGIDTRVVLRLSTGLNIEGEIGESEDDIVALHKDDRIEYIRMDAIIGFYRC